MGNILLMDCVGTKHARRSYLPIKTWVFRAWKKAETKNYRRNPSNKEFTCVRDTPRPLDFMPPFQTQQNTHKCPKYNRSNPLTKISNKRFYVFPLRIVK